MKTVFIRATEADVDSKSIVLRDAIHKGGNACLTIRFVVDPTTFRVIPKSPFAYWTSDTLRSAFTTLPAFEGGERTAKVGLQTSDDFRFVRLAIEVRPGSQHERWFPFAKGGKFSPFYADVYLVVDWQDAGLNISAYSKSYVRNPDFYFRPGLTWPLRASAFSPQPLPAGCIFSIRGYSAFVEQDQLLWTLSVFGSSIFDYLFKMIVGRTGHPEFLVGVLQIVPWPSVSPGERDQLAALARRAWSLKRTLDTRTEISHAFTLPALLQVDRPTLRDRVEAWLARVAEVEAELAALQANIDDRCFDLYGIDDAERARIEQGFSDGGEEASASSDGDEEEDETGEDEVDLEPMAASLLSWALGVALGRFDVRLATGDRALPGEPEPFDPLPVCSPGMLTGEDGLPLAAPPEGYPLAFPEDGVLVDDLGHPQDLLGRVGAVFEAVFGEQASERLNEAEGVLGRRNEDLRAWFAQRFFGNHVKRYSRSGRKAPIYWQLGTPSASYSVWCYCHRLDGDTFFRLAELVGHKVDHEESKFNTMRQEAGADPSSKQRRAIDAQEGFVAELRAFQDEVERVAPLWKPNLDDGIIIHFAPLWRLVPHDKPWQRQCKKVWDALQKGDYDWAHLAMYLWPERVVPKCAKDRSLAIAHGLESEFWLENDHGKWKPRKVNSTRVGELVAERSSTAVKAALSALVSAPVRGGAKRRGRRRGGA